MNPHFHDIWATPSREIVPGYHGRFVHGDQMTCAYWEIRAAAELPEHRHPHEQIVNMLQGEFELTVDGTPLHLKPGDVVVLKSNVPHSGRAITDCRILDVFHPIREDYLQVARPLKSGHD